MSFDQLGLSEKTLKAIADVGYTTPTPIQARVIPAVLQGRDVFGCAQTGTGKTASYTLPLLESLAKGRRRARMPRVIILTPTRELAIQVEESFQDYGKYFNFTYARIIGGESIYEQERALKKGVDVLIATPGRLLDHFERQTLLLNAVECLVIDEADRMLDMGFIPDVERIISLVPRKRQTLMFSATVPDEVRKLSKIYLLSPLEVTIEADTKTASTVQQFKLLVTGKEKRQALRHALEKLAVKQAIIFCNRKKDISTLVSSLKRHGYNAAAIHGDLTQSKRNEVLEAFKKEEVSLLIASDVAARGIDVEGLPYVFNFDVPTNPEEYVHRIGRTGRAGKEGLALSLVGEEDLFPLQNVEKIIGKEIPPFETDVSFKKPLSKKETRDVERDRQHFDKKISPHQAESSSRRKPVREPQKPVIGFGDELPAFMRIIPPISL